MNWQTIKDKIYYGDGTLRDIYVLNISKEDWAKWIQFVNQNCRVEYYNVQTKKIEDAIDRNLVFDFWDGKTDLLNNVTIQLDTIPVKCYFLTNMKLRMILILVTYKALMTILH